MLPVVSFCTTDLSFGGDIIASYRWDDRSGYPNNTFDLSRIRPKIRADFAQGFHARIDFELSELLFSENTVELKNTYITWEYNRALELGIGRRRKPYSLERYIGRWNGPSVSYTRLYNLGDETDHMSRDLGFWASGRLSKRPTRFDYDIGIYNGYRGIAETSEKQFAGRLVWSPYRAVDIATSYSMGMDTLNLEWRAAWSLGMIAEYQGIEIAADYISGEYVDIDRDFSGYQIWARYGIDKFHPFYQFENTDDGRRIRERHHIGIAYYATDEVKIRAQISVKDDEDRDGQTELLLSIFSRFR